MPKKVVIILFSLSVVFSSGEQVCATNSEVLDSKDKISSIWSNTSCCLPSITPPFIDLPTWVHPGWFIDTTLQIINLEPDTLHYTYEIIEDNGPSGWLNVSGLSGTVGAVEVGTLHLNHGGVQNVESVLLGRVSFTFNDTAFYDLEVKLVVADTVVATEVDTIAGYLSLVVSSNGNYGNMGTGRVNMDFVNNGVDCDTTADVYLYDGSPFIAKIEGSDTILYHSAFGQGWLDPNGFKPVAGQTEQREGHGMTYSHEYEFYWYFSGTFVTPDSTLAFEQRFVAPINSDKNFIIKYLRVWSNDGLSHSGIRIGDIIDWNIPSDSATKNNSGFEISKNLIYQQGVNEISIPDNCISNDTRFGGIAYSGYVIDDYNLYQDIPYSAYTASNELYVNPTSNLVPGQLWEMTNQSGFQVSSTTTDLHTVICYDSSATFEPGHITEYVTIMFSAYNETKDSMLNIVQNGLNLSYQNIFLCNADCCQIYRGNVDSSYPDDCYRLAVIDISDLIFLVDFMFTNGPSPSCTSEANINGDSQGLIDISDLVYLIEFMFNGGPQPAFCP